MALRWRNSFSCNIKEIDNQHKRLFEISSKLNILEPICSKIDFEEEILEIIRELKEYSTYHFDYEEKLMQKYHFEGLDRHHEEHVAFVNKVLDFEKVRGNFNSPESIRNITNFITGWITAHILKSDMKYKDFFNQQGIY